MSARDATGVSTEKGSNAVLPVTGIETFSMPESVRRRRGDR